MDGWPVWFRFVVAVLATWRIAHLAAHEDGPFDVIVQLRARAGDGVMGRLMDCPYCLSLWIAVPPTFWLGDTWIEWVMGWLAVSGGASLLERSGRHAIGDSGDGK
jgi:hypothetical protein